MPKKRKSTRKPTKQSSISAFLRRPLVQIGIVAVVVLIVWLLVTTASGAGGGSPPRVSGDEAYSMYQDGAFLLDVRTVEEWNEFHEPNTTHIPLDELASRVDELPRDRQIVVICRSGNRSQQGGNILLEAGFTQVVSMDGGLNAWRSSGYPIEP